MNIIDKKLKKTIKQWMAHDDWALTTNKTTWTHFFLAGVAAATPQRNTVPISKDDLNTIHELLSQINTESDGSFSLCQEAEDLLTEANKIVHTLI